MFLLLTENHNDVMEGRLPVFIKLCSGITGRSGIGVTADRMARIVGSGRDGAWRIAKHPASSSCDRTWTFVQLEHARELRQRLARSHVWTTSQIDKSLQNRQ